MARIECSPGDVSRRGDCGSVHDGSCSVVWLRGEHDLATVTDLSKIVGRAIRFRQGRCRARFECRRVHGCIDYWCDRPRQRIARPGLRGRWYCDHRRGVPAA